MKQLEKVIHTKSMSGGLVIVIVEMIKDDTWESLSHLSSIKRYRVFIRDYSPGGIKFDYSSRYADSLLEANLILNKLSNGYGSPTN